MKWTLWKDYDMVKNTKEPPCKNCKFFKPTVRCDNPDCPLPGVIYPIRFCHSPEMLPDFSCYRKIATSGSIEEILDSIESGPLLHVGKDYSTDPPTMTFTSIPNPIIPDTQTDGYIVVSKDTTTDPPMISYYSGAPLLNWTSVREDAFIFDSMQDALKTPTHYSLSGIKCTTFVTSTQYDGSDNPKIAAIPTPKKVDVMLISIDPTTSPCPTVMYYTHWAPNPWSAERKYAFVFPTISDVMDPFPVFIDDKGMVHTTTAIPV